jgi:enamine deaminase RidA (YjgF/YER057c/UK114 family)
MTSATTSATHHVENRLGELGLSLPPPPSARLGNFLGGVRVGDLLFLSGQGSHHHLGKVGGEVTVDDGYRAARECALYLLGLVKAEVGSLDRVRRIVKLLGFVNCVPGFDQTPLVLNGASDLLIELYGDAGRHARSAIGAAALPRDFAVEIEMIVQVTQP